MKIKEKIKNIKISDISEFFSNLIVKIVRGTLTGIRNFIKASANFIKANRRKISLGVFVALCIGLVIYFMPKRKNIHYEFKQNFPWTHEQLRAEFDFYILKTPEEIAIEEDSIRKLYSPLFKQLSNPQQEHEKRIADAFSNHTNMQHGILQFFDSLFILSKRGIIQDSDMKIIESFGHNHIRVYDKNPGASALESRNFITLSEARKELSKSAPDTLLLKRHILTNYECDYPATQQEHEKMTAALKTIDPVLAHIKEGERIVSNGDIVDPATERKINEYLAQRNAKEKIKSDSNWQNILLGQSLFIVACIAILLAYLNLYKKEVVKSTNKFIFTILSATIFPMLVGIMTTHGGYSVFTLPFAIVPIMLCLFIDYNAAFVTSVISIAMCSIMVASPYEFLLLQLTAGCSAILSLRELSSRSQMFKCVTITFLTYSIIYSCYEMINSAGLSNVRSLMYLYFVVSTILTLFVYPLMFLIERTFGFVSNVTLIELSNLNSKLLQRLSQEAPGTFQHSLQVGNLAAEAATAIGANSLEVRTGALYHDIGKLENPIYFTENQNSGLSPHKRLTAIESAQVIIRHVTDGITLAEKEGLPKKLQEFISTHHGLSKTGYFYVTYKNEHPDEDIDEKMFTYPGPRPHTKEQAVLMLADCVEAASHSIKEKTESNICELVDSIVDSKLREGELLMSPITFQDIFCIKEVFKKRLMAIYHTRISYPTEKEA